MHETWVGSFCGNNIADSIIEAYKAVKTTSGVHPPLCSITPLTFPSAVDLWFGGCAIFYIIVLIYFVSCSLVHNFDCVEVTFVLQNKINSFSFVFVLTYL